MRLEPLTLRHTQALHLAGQDEGIWRHLPIAPPRTVEATREWIQQAIDRAGKGTEIPFAIISTAYGAPVGSTRFLELQPENSSLEIGWTWIAPEFQRTTINTECKFLLMTHAFEVMGVVRVQLKTDGRNTGSQTAIERIGAKREGTLRKNRRLWDGFIRDTVHFSVIDSEWSEGKRHLIRLMNA